MGRIRAVLNHCLAKVPLTERCRGELALLITEASTNAVLHGHDDTPFQVRIAVTADECVMEVSNRDGDLSGVDLAAGLPAASRTGGRGLPIIVALADAVRVTRPAPGWVRLRMVKRLERQAAY